jgi:uncharacterized protein GlcG (DUF336 family)
MNINLKAALQMMHAAEQLAVLEDCSISVAIVDQGGNLVAQHRMDGAALASIDISLDKAYTALAYKEATGSLAPKCQPNQPLFGIHNSCGGRTIIFTGGFPIQKGNEIVGGIGVSGASETVDIACAEAALKAFEQ